jgi:hypothetical protein
MLGLLAEAGLEVALAIERRAKAADQDSDIDLNGLSLAYSRVSRAARVTIVLQSRLIDDLKALEEVAARKRTDAELAEDCEQYTRREGDKARVERIVERIVMAAHDDEAEINRLVIEAGHRLDDEDLYDDILSRPMGEIVALICRDIGLSPDWTRLAEEAWAQAEIASGAPGSPFAEWMGGFPLPLGGGRESPHASSP